MKRKILGFLGGLVLVFGLALAPKTALAAGDCGAPHPMGFRPWFDGLCEGSGEGATIQSPDGTKEGIGTFVWTIVLNVVFDVLLVVGYLAVGFVIYGGYLYIASQGDPAKAAKGKRTLMTAIIGVIIAMGSSVIVNTGTTILGIDRSKGWEQQMTDSQFNEQIQNAFNWAYAMAGLVAVIFIVYGGVTYLTSQGDPAKASKATRTIIYAVVGLVIVILASLITAFVTESIGGSIK